MEFFNIHRVMDQYKLPIIFCVSFFTCTRTYRHVRMQAGKMTHNPANNFTLFCWSTAGVGNLPQNVPKQQERWRKPESKHGGKYIKFRFFQQSSVQIFSGKIKIKTDHLQLLYFHLLHDYFCYFSSEQPSLTLRVRSRWDCLKICTIILHTKMIWSFISHLIVNSYDHC